MGTTNISDEMMARMNELRAKEESGTIDDQGRMELKQLRTQMDTDKTE